MLVKTTLAATAIALSLAAQAGAQTPAPASPATQATPATPSTPATSAPAAAASTVTSPNLAAAGDIAATIKASPKFTILAKALDAANLTPVLKQQPGLTLFAPTDDAFNALPPATLQALMETKNGPILQKILTYHLVNARLDQSKVKGAKGPVNSVEGAPLQIDGSADPAKVDNAAVVQTVLVANNGVIHVVDKVLLPPGVDVPAAP